MRSPRLAGPADLVALVSFDGEVYANQAVTRDRLGSPAAAPHGLAAAMQQWLGRKPTWIDVRGRQIQGIATARELADHSVWEIDTLVDATDGQDEVVAGLLRQAAQAASEAGVGRLLLRTRSEAPARDEALRAGFTPAMTERLWVRERSHASPPVAADDIGVREGSDADAFFDFQVYSRALPFEARRALGMTFEEWAAALERPWGARGARRYLASQGGQPRAVARIGGQQLLVLVEPGHENCADVLLAQVSEGLRGRVLALQPECGGTPAGELRAHGFEPGDSYTLLTLRTMRPLREEARERVRVRTVVPSGG